jgi:hypothetical protein
MQMKMMMTTVVVVQCKSVMHVISIITTINAGMDSESSKLSFAKLTLFTKSRCSKGKGKAIPLQALRVPGG